MDRTVTQHEAVVSLTAGDVAYRVVAPLDAAQPSPVVLVHGLLTDGHLWDPVADRLAAKGFRCVLPTLPLGSHRLAMRADADLSVPGVADLLAEFLVTLDLSEVTLVGGDSGGAICQFLLDRHPERIGRLVLTNCEAFSTYPPPMFVPLVRLIRTRPGVALLARLTRLRAVRHSPLGYGDLIEAPRDDALLRSWLAGLQDPRVRADLRRTARSVRRGDLAATSARMHEFDGPVRLVWGTGDRHFPVGLAERLRTTFRHAVLDRVTGGRTFFFLSRPEPVVDAVVQVSRLAPAHADA